MDDTVVEIVFCVLIIFWIGAFVIQADAYKVLVWSPFLFLLVFGLAEEVLRVTLVLYQCRSNDNLDWRDYSRPILSLYCRQGRLSVD